MRFVRDEDVVRWIGRNVKVTLKSGSVLCGELMDTGFPGKYQVVPPISQPNMVELSGPILEMIGCADIDKIEPA